MLFPVSKMRLREVKCFSKCHPASQWQSGHRNLHLCNVLRSVHGVFSAILVPHTHGAAILSPSPDALYPLAPSSFASGSPPLDSWEVGAWCWPRLEPWHCAPRHSLVTLGQIRPPSPSPQLHRLYGRTVTCKQPGWPRLELRGWESWESGCERGGREASREHLL